MARIRKIALNNFRNLKDCSFRPHPKLNVFCGLNGQGKTSLLEALSFVATLRSFRGAKTEEVVAWDESCSEVKAVLGPDQGEPGGWESDFAVVFNRIETSRGPSWRKSAWINGKAFKSSAQFLRQRFGSFELGFHTVVFNPSDHDLIRGEPAGRRSYLDRVLIAESIEYLELLQRYQRLLMQRNALLKADPAPSSDLIDNFTEPMAKLASKLTFERLIWLQRLLPGLKSKIAEIAPRQQDLTLFFTSSWVPPIAGLLSENRSLVEGHFTGQERQGSLELLEQAYWTRVSALRQAELRAGSSLVGPHRDDWALFLGQLPLKGHGSQGEVRSSLLALKLTEIELFREATGHRPLFLLDDFSSELDRERRAFLLSYLQSTDLQVFITTTEESVFDSFEKFEGIREGALFVVTDGCVLLRKSLGAQDVLENKREI